VRAVVESARNPFNGIERFSRLGALHRASFFQNPFNGIERMSWPVAVGLGALIGIRSMELKGA